MKSSFYNTSQLFTIWFARVFGNFFFYKISYVIVRILWLKKKGLMVGVTGFEPVTSSV